VRTPVLTALGTLIAISLGGAAELAHADTNPAGVVVIGVHGTLDGRISDLVTGGLTSAAKAGAAAAVLDLSSPGGQPAPTAAMLTALRQAPLPTLAWLAAPAQATGTALQLLDAVDVVASADATLRHPGVVVVSGGLDKALARIDGRSLTRNGHTWRLHTAGSALGQIRLSGFDGVRQGLADANVAFLLLVLAIAFLGLFAAHPANPLALLGMVAAAAGAFSGLTDLPIRWIGVALIAVSVVLFISDLVVTSHGVVTFVGLLTLIAGGGLLVDHDMDSATVSAVLIAACGLLIVGAYAMLIPRLVAARRLPAPDPLEELVGRVASVTEALGPAGMVRLGGTFWQARTAGGARVAPGGRVRVLSNQGLQLLVEPAEDHSRPMGSLSPEPPVPVKRPT